MKKVVSKIKLPDYLWEKIEEEDLVERRIDTIDLEQEIMEKVHQTRQHIKPPHFRVKEKGLSK